MNVPNPAIATLSPVARLSAMVENTASTTLGSVAEKGEMTLQAKSQSSAGTKQLHQSARGSSVSVLRCQTESRRRDTPCTAPLFDGLRCRDWPTWASRAPDDRRRGAQSRRFMVNSCFHVRNSLVRTSAQRKLWVFMKKSSMLGVSFRPFPQLTPLGQTCVTDRPYFTSQAASLNGLNLS